MAGIADRYWRRTTGCCGRWLRHSPDITLREIQAELRRRCGVWVCLATIHVRLRRLGLRHKKRR
jgi:transposase